MDSRGSLEQPKNFSFLMKDSLLRGGCYLPGTRLIFILLRSHYHVEGHALVTHALVSSTRLKKWNGIVWSHFGTHFWLNGDVACSLERKGHRTRHQQRICVSPSSLCRRPSLLLFNDALLLCEYNSSIVINDRRNVVFPKTEVIWKIMRVSSDPGKSCQAYGWWWGNVHCMLRMR